MTTYFVAEVCLCCAVFQINAKLYVFQKESQSWIERGRGLLRLNDMSNTERQSFQSRLGVFYSLIRSIIRYIFSNIRTISTVFTGHHML